MPSVTTIDGYTFNNLGPLTTTFTPPASCTTGTAGYQVAITESELDTLILQYGLQCSTMGGLDCVPPGSQTDVKPTSSMNRDPAVIFNRAYYSPGLYCPHDWSTVGVAEYNNGTVTGMGVFKPTPTDPLDNYGAFETPGTLLMSLLDPSETAVVCCPESMTAHLSLGCYSTVPDYKPTVGCFEIVPDQDLGTATKTATVNGTVTRYPIPTLIGTAPMTSTVISTFKESDMSTLVGVNYAAMVTMIYREGEDMSQDSGSSATAGDGTGTSAATSNAATRGSHQSSWNGLLPVLGVSAAAVVLGAAMILPF